jgi:thioredoxin 1
MISKKIIEIAEWEYLIKEHDAMMVYLYSEKCNVCTSLFPKVKELIENKFPKVTLIILDAIENRGLAAQIRMFSVPGIILFIDGKEQFRANGLVMLSELERKIEKPYRMMFE